MRGYNVTSYELEKKRWRRLPYACDSEYVWKERERLAKRDQARLPVLQEKREQQRAEQLARDAEDKELMRTTRIFWNLLERAHLIPFYYEDPRYFDQPRVPSFFLPRPSTWTSRSGRRGHADRRRLSCGRQGGARSPSTWTRRSPSRRGHGGRRRL